MFSTNPPAQGENCMVLLSGGLDSAVALALASRNYAMVHTITFGYNQKHSKETECAEALSQHYICTSRTYSHIELLTHIHNLGKDDAVVDEYPTDRLLPVTWKPGRNAIFLSLAATWAYEHDCHVLALGVHQQDYSGYPDCRTQFLIAMEQAMHLALACHVELWAPLLDMRKSEIVTLGYNLDVPFGMTWSCYAGGETPCGKCDACKYRIHAFKEAGLVDE